ncbi:ATPase family AAA domain-containing protein 5b [Periophthalmus magnuspinnatus]|uniref:ATPase family AAA domain-containing protein 5b n=1 Tax=Periophthalmus magnuspinnatus TaxID=409849 RepID=UPI0024369078|nr:ATPase family AAA domain-containing protein 5b [Periophthalmus magnuspinnatus]
MRAKLKRTKAKTASNCTGVLAATKKTPQTPNVSVYSRFDATGVDCKEPDELHMSHLDLCLRHVQASNPTFPVNNFFSVLRRKSCANGQCFASKDEAQSNSKEDDNQEAHGRSRETEEDATTTFSPSHVLQDGSTSAPEKTQRRSRLSRTRRLRYGSGKLENIIELENKRTQEKKTGPQSKKTSVLKQREPFRDDVLWTDKYRPRCSNEIVGNTEATEKLHSWLNKWKLKTDAEEEGKKLKERQNEGRSNDSWDCGDFEDEVGPDDGTEEQLCNTVLISGPPGVGKTASVYACAVELGFKVFEVNCSSRRSGREVLSQLKEATQSHLVDGSGNDSLKPTFFSSSSSVCGSHRPDPAVKTHKKTTTTTSTSKKNSGQIRSSCKKRAKPNTLTSYFKTKAKADYLYHSRMKSCNSPCEKSTTKRGPTDSAACDDHDETNSKTAATSLILFEEVDVIFEEDVGFFAAIKTFMATTKRPVVMTTSDPLFRERFNSSLKEIIFQTPSMGDVCSFLRLVCLAENVQLDPDDVTTLFTVTGGDVRRCLLQLQLWSNSGAGQRRHRINVEDDGYNGCSANMLGLQSLTTRTLLQLLQITSWMEQQMTELLLPMIESWRNGFPILYSNLERLLQVNEVNSTRSGPDDKLALGESQQIKTFSPYSARSAAETRSRLSRKKNITSAQKKSSSIQISEKLETANSLIALADFFDVMSFIDSTVPTAPKPQPTLCSLRGFVWTGAKLQDGQLDEMREEEDKNEAMTLDIRAALEALGFHCCWRKFSDSYEVQRQEGDASNGRNLNYISQHPDPNMFDLSKNVLSSRYFSLLQNKGVVCVDYLPVIRLICRTHKKRKKHTDELDRSVRTRLGLSKDTVRFLADDFS